MRILAIKTVLYLSALLPLPLLHGLGSLVGWGLLLVPNRTRETARRNIALCFPAWTADAQARLLRRSLLETGKTVMETGALWLRPAGMTLRLVRGVDNAALIEEAVGAGEGAILATPHLGAWEMAGLYCAARFDITCLYRPLRLTRLEPLVNRARSRAGGRYVPAGAGGIRTLFRTLEEGGTVAMLPDQEPQAGSGVFAPFFGIPASTMVFLSRLAARSRAPLVFVWCERLSWGRGYRLHFRKPSRDCYSKDPVTSATAINRAVEDCIRECPAQYQWGYKRFRTRPEGDAPLY